jgi:hypothetical protein
MPDYIASNIEDIENKKCLPVTYKKKLIEYPCDYCGEITLKHPFRFKLYKNLFCSHECHDKFRERKKVL